MLGYFNANIGVGNRSVRGKVYVSEHGDSLLGWPHQRHLRVKVDPNSVPQVVVNEVTEKGGLIVSKYGRLFGDKLGCLKGYKHRIRVKQDCLPSVAKPRRIPMNLYDAV